MEGEGDFERVPPAVEESAACEKTALEMEDLPNEMLKSILEELVVVDPERPYRWSQESWDSKFRSVVAYRQVCSPWRDFLDEILEKSLLTTIRAWCPPYHYCDTDPDPIVNLDVLVNILERSANIKALVIRSLTVSKDKSPRPLPPLPQLKTLVIKSVKTGPTVDSRFRLIPSFSQWLVEPYACQLIELVNDFEVPLTAPLPNLKQLTLLFPVLGVVQQNGPAVSLLRLCVTLVGEDHYYYWTGNIYDVFNYVDKFSKTLVDLFLNVYWSDLIPEASDDDEAEEDEEALQQQRQDQFIEELQRVYGKLPTSKTKFPHLKTLAFPQAC